VNDSVFRIPATELHVRGDGSLRAVTGRDLDHVEHASNIVELTTAEASELGPAYAGNALMTTLDAGDAAAMAEAMGHAVDVVEFFSLTGDIIEAGAKLDAWITNAAPDPDPAMQTLQRIDASLARIEDLALASWASQRMDNMAFLRAHSSAALHTVNAFLYRGDPHPDGIWLDKLALADRDSLIAVETFAAGGIDGGFWKRPNSLKAMSWAGDPMDYYRGWMPHLPDRAAVDSFGLVWDYRWALPALAYAIAVRFVVVRVLSQDWDEICREMQGYVGVLQDAFLRMNSGVKNPRVTDLMRHEFGTTGRMPAAAADIYGGYFVARVIYGGHFAEETLAVPPGAYPSGLNLSAYHVDAVSANIELLNNYWWGHVCTTIGLPDLLVLISNISQGACISIAKPFAGIDEWQRKVTATRTNPKARRAAKAATNLLQLETRAPEQPDPTRLFRVYEALRSDDERVRALTAQYIDELIQVDVP
jgi:hypothetical protein